MIQVGAQYQYVTDPQTCGHAGVGRGDAPCFDVRSFGKSRPDPLIMTSGVGVGVLRLS